MKGIEKKNGSQTLRSIKVGEFYVHLSAEHRFLRSPGAGYRIGRALANAPIQRPRSFPLSLLCPFPPPQSAIVPQHLSGEEIQLVCLRGHGVALTGELASRDGVGRGSGGEHITCRTNAKVRQSRPIVPTRNYTILYRTVKVD